MSTRWPVPLPTLSTTFGLGPEEARAMLGHSRRIFRAKGAEGAEALKAQKSLIVDLVARRRQRPSDDLTSAILRHPSRPSDEDVQSAVSTMLVLGSEFEVAWITQVAVEVALRRLGGVTLTVPLDPSRSTRCTPREPCGRPCRGGSRSGSRCLFAMPRRTPPR